MKILTKKKYLSLGTPFFIFSSERLDLAQKVNPTENSALHPEQYDTSGVPFPSIVGPQIRKKQSLSGLQNSRRQLVTLPIDFSSLKTYTLTIHEGVMSIKNIFKILSSQRPLATPPLDIPVPKIKCLQYGDTLGILRQ